MSPVFFWFFESEVTTRESEEVRCDAMKERPKEQSCVSDTEVEESNKEMEKGSWEVSQAKAFENKETLQALWNSDRTKYARC